MTLIILNSVKPFINRIFTQYLITAELFRTRK